MAQDELKRFENQNEQHKQEIQQLVQSLDEQRSLLSEFELKFTVDMSINYYISIQNFFRSLKPDVLTLKMNDKGYKLILKIIINEHII